MSNPPQIGLPAAKISADVPHAHAKGQGGRLHRRGAQRRGLLTRTLVLRRLLRRHVLAADEQFVGVLLPPSVGGVVTNAALAIDRRMAVNLNYTASSEVMNSCINTVRHSPRA